MVCTAPCNDCNTLLLLIQSPVVLCLTLKRMYMYGKGDFSDYLNFGVNRTSREDEEEDYLGIACVTGARKGIIKCAKRSEAREKERELSKNKKCMT